jgi:hypothetical protein
MDITNNTLRKMEKRDCAVVAVALMVGITYDEAHDALKAAGRKDRAGTPMPCIAHGMRLLGHPILNAPHLGIIKSYPGIHSTLKNVTTHHFRRFENVWRDAPDFMILSRNHILAVIGGKVQDWSVNNTLRAVHTYIRASDRDAWAEFYAARSGSKAIFHPVKEI